MKGNTVTFKSNSKNYWKEKYGLKPNTFRKVDDDDERFEMLRNGEATYIFIENTDIVSFEMGTSKEGFLRIIKDITFWDDYVIISWENRDAFSQSEVKG